MDICRERQYQAFVCDALAVPIRSGSCDACISIAVIHHFATAVSIVFLAPKTYNQVAGRRNKMVEEYVDMEYISPHGYVRNTLSDTEVLAEHLLRVDREPDHQKRIYRTRENSVG